MKLPVAGALLAVTVLGGCIAPVAQREAQQIATTRLDKYCRGRCGTYTKIQEAIATWRD